MMYKNVQYHVLAFLLTYYQEKMPISLSTCVPLDVKLIGGSIDEIIQCLYHCLGMETHF